MGKENGYMTQMIDKMKTTRVPMAEPDTMVDLFLNNSLPDKSSSSVNEWATHSNGG